MAAALTATLLWGVNFSAAKRVLQEVDPLAVAAARALGGVVVFAALLLLLDGPRGFAWARLKRAAPLGLLGVFANQIFFSEGLKRTSAAHSAVLISLLPLYVLLLSVAFGQERLNPWKGVGIITAFAGVVLVASEHGARAAGAATLKGDLITMCGGLSFAAYTVLGR